MKRVLSLMLVVVLCGSGLALANHHAVKIAEKAGIGAYLTDAEGHTLYYFAKDMPGKSACAGDCVKNWPLYYRENVAPTGGLDAKDFGTLVRDDGEKQSTFRGYPLYYWRGDNNVGDTNGQGVKGVWFVIDPAKFPAK